MNISAWQEEIEDLHHFFEAWLGGSLPRTEETFSRLPLILDPGFTLISPTGEVATRAELLETLWREHGVRGEWRIWIERPQLRYEDEKVVLATYEEWQMVGGKTTARLSTALFSRTPTAPHGLNWLHVHETWLNTDTL